MGLIASLELAPNPEAATSFPPNLRIERSATGIFLGWPKSAGSFQLEGTDLLGSVSTWTPVATPAIDAGIEWRVPLSAGPSDRYFRLRQAGEPGPTRLETTSPAAGETGVSVNRETILRFSRPLALNTRLDTDQFHLRAGGRLLISRVEIAADRRGATLFPLENLPGGARIEVTLDATELFDESGTAVDADADGFPGGVASIQFDTAANQPVPGTAIMGRVFASDLQPGADTGTNAVNHPLAGVTITVDGAEETLRATTDEQGNFTLSPCPAGRFFVHVDGRTAWESQWPSGAYYPFVGKAWEAVAGVTTNLAGGNGEIFLPRIVEGTLQPVSGTAETTIAFPQTVVSANPALAGVTLIIPRNALFTDQGSRGGRAGIAPVPPDRLPEPLPPGLTFPLVITVQTDGPANFDQPVTVRFPNLPDPRTGQPLAPGAKTALWSFNHDTGRWEIQGPMTVSADGRFIDCDPGTGLRQPGWVGTNPGTPGTGGPPRPPRPPAPPDKDPDCDDPFTLVAKENLLLTFADGMNAISGSGNYAGDALTHFLMGDGSPQNYPDGSGPSNDLRNSRAFQEELPDIQSALRSQVNQAIQQNSEFPTVDDFRHRTGSMGFYGEPGELLHQLSYTFGDISDQNVNAQLGDIAVTHLPDGGYEYFATLKFKISETYEFNKNDPDGLVGMARQLQDCGYATRFDVSIEFELPLRGTVPPPRGPALLAPQNPGPPTSSLLSGPGPHLYAPTDITREIVVGKERLVLQPNGRSSLIQIDGRLSGRFDYLVEDAADGLFLARGTVRGAGQLFTDLILPPARRVRIRAAHHETLMLGEVTFTTANNGLTTTIPPLAFAPLKPSLDTDADGLDDELELVLGTRADLTDSDGDGSSDLAEIRSGQDPLSGLATGTGIVASVRTSGSPSDIDAFNNLVVVADGSAGVAVFNVFAGLDPLRVAQLPTEAPPTAVACNDHWIVAGHGTRVSIWEIGLTPILRHSVNVPGSPTEVAIDADSIYVGIGNEVALLEARTGTLLDRRPMTGQAGEGIHDLTIAGDHLYVLSASPGTSGSHSVLKSPIAPLLIPPTASITIPGTDHPTFGRMHLAVGDGRIFIGSADDNANTQRPGVLILEDTLSGPRIVGRPSPITAFDVEPTGSGLALFTGADPGLTSSAKVGVLDVRTPAITDRFLTSFDTPGTAVAIAVYNGLAYVTDSQAGLQVIHFVPLDRNGVAPTVRLVSNADPSGIDAGARLRLTAETTEDVQVRQVEFFADDTLLAADGRFPFEHAFLAPTPTPDRPRLRLRARATDTGGNARWSEVLEIPLLAGQSTRGVLRPIPPPGASSPSVSSFGLLLDAAAAGNAESQTNAFSLTWAGPDAQLDTPDDRPVSLGVLRYLPGARALFQGLPDELRPGLYRAKFAGNINDAGGRAFPATQWEFHAASVTPFRVRQTTPSPGTVTGVVSVSVTASEAIDRNTVAADSLRVVGPGPDGTLGTADDVVVPGRVGLSVSGDRLDFTPDDPVAPGRYRATLKGIITDLSGLALGNDYVWEFDYQDTESPVTEAFQPEDTRVLDEPVTRVEAYFSEPMDARSLNSETFQLLASGADEELLTADDTVVRGSVTYSSTLRRATLTFPGDLPPGAYLYTLDPRIQDLGGRPLRVGALPRFIVTKKVRLQGIAVLESGAPAAGITLRVGGVDRPLITATDGSFLTDTFSVVPGRRIQVRAEAADGPRLLAGSTEMILPKHGTITDAGPLVLVSLCPPRLESSGFTPAALRGEVNAFTKGDTGNGLTFYGATGSFYGDQRSRVGRWTGSDWAPVGDDFKFAFGGPAHIRSLAIHDDGEGPRLYAGGEFDRVGVVQATNIARWNGSAWEAVGTGLTGIGVRGQVNALIAFNPGGGTRLLAGGTFTVGSSGTRAGVMAWDGTQWSPFSGGLSNSASMGITVSALAAGSENNQPVLYAGGSISRVGTQPAANLVRWTENGWAPVPGGLTRQGQTNLTAVRALALFPAGESQQLFVGGDFSEAGGQPALAIARWTGTRWLPAGSGFQSSSQNRIGSVTTLHVTDAPTPELFAAGIFDTFDQHTNRFFNGPSLARWNGSNWDAPADSSGRTLGIHGFASALASFDNGQGSRLFVGGQFTDVYVDRFLARLEFVARRDTAGWEPAGQELDRPVGVFAHAEVGTNAASLFAGGAFRWGGGAALKGIYRQSSQGFEPLGGGLSHAALNVAGEVFAMAPGNLGGVPSLYVGGSFAFAGTNDVNSVARWDGNQWHPLSDGVRSRGFPGIVSALHARSLSTGRELAVGGFFDTAGGIPAQNVAVWTGTNWINLGNGLPGSVLALTSFPVFGLEQWMAGGSFAAVDEQFRPARNVARWDGARWVGLRGSRSESPNGQVLSLAAHDDGFGTALFAAGDFAEAPDGSHQNCVGRWDGYNWTYLTEVSGGLRFSQVTQLVSFREESGSMLYAVVRPMFTEANGGEPRLARWDGSRWEVFAESRVDTLNALISAQNRQPPALLLGGGDGPFAGRTWSWSRPSTPCPDPVSAATP